MTQKSSGSVEGIDTKQCRFFFSSRRRHTRCYRDWSSDVCSSDLLEPELPGVDDELVALAEQPVNRRERRGHLPGELGLFLFRELFLVDVHDFLDRDVVPAELLPQLAESLEGQVGAEDGR